MPKRKSYVDCLITFIDRQRSNYVAQEEKAPVGPQPVITIDGVDYYHKCEFDLEEILDSMDTWATKAFDILTKEEVASSSYPNIKATKGNVEAGSTISFMLSSYHGQNSVFIYKTAGGVAYESHAFPIVDTPEEIDSAEEICLPSCSAYYGFLSKDGKTFISYYNLKEEE